MSTTILQAVEAKSAAFVLYRDLEATSRKTWLVHNLLGEGEASAMYGKPGDGKSVLAEDLALHVAAGRAWHGRKIMQGAVLYVALERRKLVERRAIAFRIAYEFYDLPFAIVGGVFDFRDPRTATAIVEIVREVEQATGQAVVLIVIDTLSRALCGGDENSPKDMGAIVTATGRLQTQTSAHVLWSHHMPLDGGDRMRGHGALLGALDTTIHVVKVGPVRTATVVKANDSEEGERIVFSLESVVVGQNEEGEQTTAPIVVSAAGEGDPAEQSNRRLNDRHKLALAALTESIFSNGTAAPPEFQLPAGVRVVNVDAWREELFRRGLIDRNGKNPRQDFKRIREALAVRCLIGERDNLVWAA